MNTTNSFDEFQAQVDGNYLWGENVSSFSLGLLDQQSYGGDTLVWEAGNGNIYIITTRQSNPGQWYMTDLAGSFLYYIDCFELDDACIEVGQPFTLSSNWMITPKVTRIEVLKTKGESELSLRLPDGGQLYKAYWHGIQAKPEHITSLAAGLQVQKSDPASAAL